MMANLDFTRIFITMIHLQKSMKFNINEISICESSKYFPYVLIGNRNATRQGVIESGLDCPKSRKSIIYP